MTRERDWALREVNGLRLEYAGESEVARALVAVLGKVFGALPSEIRWAREFYYTQSDLEHFAKEPPSRAKFRAFLKKTLAPDRLPKEAADTFRDADALLERGRHVSPFHIYPFLDDAHRVIGWEALFEALEIVSWKGAQAHTINTIAGVLEDLWGWNQTPRAELMKHARRLTDNFERANGTTILAVWTEGLVRAFAGFSAPDAKEALRDLARYVVNKALWLEDAGIKASDPETYYSGLEGDAPRVPAFKADPRKVFNRQDIEVSDLEIEHSQGLRNPPRRNGPVVLTPCGPKRLRPLPKHDRRTGRFVGRGRQ